MSARDRTVIDQQIRPADSGIDLRSILADVVSGGLVAVVVASYCLSFAVLIFSGPLSKGLSFGVSATLMSAAITSIAVAAFGSFRFSVAGPDAATMAVCSVIAAGITAGLPLGGDPAHAVVLVIAVLAGTTIITGLTLFGLGALKLGSWMRYVPYPVVGGFLAAAGWLLFSGGIRVASGQSSIIDVVAALNRPDTILHLVAAAAFAMLIVVARRWSSHYAMWPIVLVGGAAVVHAGLMLAGMTVAEAQALRWLLPDVGGTGPWSIYGQMRFQPGDSSILSAQAMEAATAAVVTALAILLNSTGIEIARKTTIDLDHDLKVHGIANMLVGLLGGLVGNISFNRSALLCFSGARTRLGGIVVGLVCLIAAVAGSAAFGYVPTPILGGLLIFLGGSVMWEWLVRTWRRLSHIDYLLIVVMLVLIVGWGYIPGVVLGVVASCMIFALSYSRVRNVKHVLSRQEYQSTIERSCDQANVLRERGNAIQILWLQGFLFFGTANRLLKEIEARIEQRGPEPVRVIILDFGFVSGIDSSAVFSFIKLRNVAHAHGVMLVYCAMAPAVALAFAAEGALVGDGFVRVSPNLDVALEWAEELLLVEWPEKASAAPEFETWLAQQMDGAGDARRLLAYGDRLEIERGETLFRQGDPADSLYIIVSGRLSVVYARPGGEPIRLRTMTGCTVVGEMGLYRDACREASVVADEPSQVFRLTKGSFDRMAREDPATAGAFHRLVVRVVSDRLSFATREIAALQR